jgi:site-specific DNA recombinase
MIPAFLYARVSSREQEQEGFSIPAQLKLTREYAAKNYFTIIEEFVDIETAKTPGRKEFERLVRSVSANRSCRTILTEKTDRLYRNFRDAVTLEDLDVEVHLIKEGQIISRNARSQVRLIHGMQLVLARNYIENLREEVIKGMNEKAEQGHYPGRAPFGYINNKADRTIAIHPSNSAIVLRIFECFATGEYSLAELRAVLFDKFGIKFVKSYLHTLLKNRFYVGEFEWSGNVYQGRHPRIIRDELFARVQDIFVGRNKRKRRKHNIAFRGLLTCAEDNCAITAEVQKKKYVYYRCTGYRGKCKTPYFREEEVSHRLGEVLKNILVPDEVAQRLEESFSRDEVRIKAEAAAQRERDQRSLDAVRRRMDQAYSDKLEGKIPEDFWRRKMSEWREEEQRIQQNLKAPVDSFPARVLTAKRIIELANKAYSLYLTQEPHEQAKLLRMVLLNCSIDGTSLYPCYRKPFDMIFRRAKTKEWSGREDLNLRPLVPKKRLDCRAECFQSYTVVLQPSHFSPQSGVFVNPRVAALMGRS